MPDYIESMEEPDLPGIDTGIANAARVYDYLLGGSENFPADRAMAAEMLRLVPETAEAVRRNRAFLRRAVGFLAGEMGIGQFLDIGSGLPTMDNVHQVARRSLPDARVVYVDIDPAVVRHTEALLAGTTGLTVIQQDTRNPEGVLGRAAAALDFSRPVALVLVAIMHFIPDADQPQEIVRRYARALAPGSYLVLSHASVLAADPDVAEAASTYASSSAGSFIIRTPNEVAAFFDGFDLLEPGLVEAGLWRTAQAEPIEPGFLAGIGRKRPPIEGLADTSH
jgi:SAM-dependent methyltransferase